MLVRGANSSPHLLTNADGELLFFDAGDSLRALGVKELDILSAGSCDVEAQDWTNMKSFWVFTQRGIVLLHEVPAYFFLGHIGVSGTVPSTALEVYPAESLK